MNPFISGAFQNSLQNQFYRLHDQFARPITIYKQAEQIVISTNSNNNMFFPNAPFNDQVQNILVSGQFNARIKYLTREDMKFFSDIKGGEDQNTLKYEDGMVRIKLDVTGAAFIKDATRAILDGDTFEILTSKRPHGLFTPIFYDFILKKVN